tara:strand:+ start:100 stop:213 length:114 start_codon:yes stop_codon:yes gene_type:complete
MVLPGLASGKRPAARRDLAYLPIRQLLQAAVDRRDGA